MHQVWICITSWQADECSKVSEFVSGYYLSLSLSGSIVMHRADRLLLTLPPETSLSCEGCVYFFHMKVQFLVPEVLSNQKLAIYFPLLKRTTDVRGFVPHHNTNQRTWNVIQPRECWGENRLYGSDEPAVLVINKHAVDNCNKLKRGLNK